MNEEENVKQKEEEENKMFMEMYQGLNCGNWIIARWKGFFKLGWINVKIQKKIHQDGCIKKIKKMKFSFVPPWPQGFFKGTNNAKIR